MDIKLPEGAREALNRLEQAGWEAYIVGGCVRDSIMGRVPGDYDITTSARPEQVIECFSGEKIIPTGLKHGTVTVMLHGMPLEITTFRADGEYSDHRRPDSVNFSQSLEDDLCRRDFTVNAMAYSERRGLVDMYGGVDDINRRIIRCVGDAHKRFNEDALRMLRAVRFAATLGFVIASDTLAALLELQADISYVARERIYAELNKAICADNPDYAFNTGRELVLRALELGEADFPGYGEAVRRVVFTPRVPELRWAALLMDLGSDRGRRTLLGLRASNTVINRAGSAISNVTQSFIPERVNVLWLLNAMGKAGLDDAVEISRAEAMRSGNYAQLGVLNGTLKIADELEKEGACWSLKTLEITGEELKALGFTGRQIGNALEKLLGLVIEGNLPNDGNALRAFATDVHVMEL